jgi:hypothetical protein
MQRIASPPSWAETAIPVALAVSKNCPAANNCTSRRIFRLVDGRGGPAKRLRSRRPTGGGHPPTPQPVGHKSSLTDETPFPRKPSVTADTCFSLKQKPARPRLCVLQTRPQFGPCLAAAFAGSVPSAGNVSIQPGGDGPLRDAQHLITASSGSGYGAIGTASTGSGAYSKSPLPCGRFIKLPSRRPRIASALLS